MPRRAQPTTAPQARDPALDGLRGLAVLLVFLFHYGGGLRAHNPILRALGYLAQAGWIGVELFFALSGFLITGILADTLLVLPPSLPDPALNSPGDTASGPGAPGFSSDARIATPSPNPVARFNRRAANLRNFYARRALRILPLYLAALLACAAAALLTGAALPQLKPLLIYVAFLQNLPAFLTAALHTPPPLPVFHLWSLAVEEQFYLLWPFALLAARTPRRALHLSLSLFALSCVFRAILFAPHLLPWATANSFAITLPARAGALALGSALALHHRKPVPTSLHAAFSTTVERPEDTPERRTASAQATDQPALLLAATLALGIIVVTALQAHSFLLSGRTSFVVTLPAADLLAAALVGLSLQPNRLRGLLSARPLGFLGRISYGFYVLHLLLEPAFDHLGGALTHAHAGFGYQTARLLCALPLSIAAAWLSFTLLERPFLRLEVGFPRSSLQVTENFQR